MPQPGDKNAKRHNAYPPPLIDPTHQEGTEALGLGFEIKKTRVCVWGGKVGATSRLLNNGIVFRQLAQRGASRRCGALPLTHTATAVAETALHLSNGTA
eukprot:3282848-Amphidinium_carterae.1